MSNEAADERPTHSHSSLLGGIQEFSGNMIFVTIPEDESEGEALKCAGRQRRCRLFFAAALVLSLTANVLLAVALARVLHG